MLDPQMYDCPRNMAAREGFAPPNLLKLLDILKANGRVYAVDDFTNEERA